MADECTMALARWLRSAGSQREKVAGGCGSGFQSGANGGGCNAAMRVAFEKVGVTILAEWQKSAGADGEAIIAAFQKR